ncbi:hypothetical protein EGR_05257 [Echinococcus granulosus]|uniref:Uncharacterized protein n=1 Tax=Echinococcus granulosus TaxID=6210 RepID=W6UG15_ECHGR|nr:hypothetical protein EGR_05257 [Echinococcus granulosus]EUB59931.1 hypothetical protein EGR_05257 [Echinococcus granulosus]
MQNIRILDTKLNKIHDKSCLKLVRSDKKLSIRAIFWHFINELWRFKNKFYSRCRQPHLIIEKKYSFDFGAGRYRTEPCNSCLDGSVVNSIPEVQENGEVAGGRPHYQPFLLRDVTVSHIHMTSHRLFVKVQNAFKMRKLFTHFKFAYLTLNLPNEAGSILYSFLSSISLGNSELNGTPPADHKMKMKVKRHIGLMRHDPEKILHCTLTTNSQSHSCHLILCLSFDALYNFFPFVCKLIVLSSSSNVLSSFKVKNCLLSIARILNNFRVFKTFECRPSSLLNYAKLHYFPFNTGDKCTHQRPSLLEKNHKYIVSYASKSCYLVIQSSNCLSFVEVSRRMEWDLPQLVHLSLSDLSQSSGADTFLAVLLAATLPLDTDQEVEQEASPFMARHTRLATFSFNEIQSFLFSCVPFKHHDLKVLSKVYSIKHSSIPSFNILKLDLRLQLVLPGNSSFFTYRKYSFVSEAFKGFNVLVPAIFVPISLLFPNELFCIRMFDTKNRSHFSSHVSQSTNNLKTERFLPHTDEMNNNNKLVISGAHFYLLMVLSRTGMLISRHDLPFLSSSIRIRFCSLTISVRYSPSLKSLGYRCIKPLKKLMFFEHFKTFPGLSNFTYGTSLLNWYLEEQTMVVISEFELFQASTPPQQFGEEPFQLGTFVQCGRDLLGTSTKLLSQSSWVL